MFISLINNKTFDLNNLDQIDNRIRLDEKKEEVACIILLEQHHCAIILAQ